MYEYLERLRTAERQGNVDEVCIEIMSELQKRQEKIIKEIEMQEAEAALQREEEESLLAKYGLTTE